MNDKDRINAAFRESLDEIRQERDKRTLPTQAQLATLAANLATGNESTTEALQDLVEKALDLWEESGRALTKRSIDRGPSGRILERRMKAFRDAGLEPPQDGQDFTFEEALIYLMPQKKPEDRAKAVRDHLTFAIHENPLAFAQSVDEEMGRLRETGFHYPGFCEFACRFLPWLKADKSTKRSEAGKTKKPKAENVHDTPGGG